MTEQKKIPRVKRNEYVLHSNYAEIFVKDEYGTVKGTFIIDLEDVELCKKHRWRFIKASHGEYTRVITDINNKHVVLHKYLLNYWGSHQIDHINRNTLDNRRSNLRIVSSCENNANKGKDTVYLQSNGKYRCSFIRYGKFYHVGYFSTREEAIKAKEEKLKEIEKNKEKLKREYDRMKTENDIGISPTPSGKWRSFYKANGKLFSIGIYETKDEAIRARDEYIKSQAS